LLACRPPNPGFARRSLSRDKARVHNTVWATFLRSGLGRPDVGVRQFADAFGSLVAEFAGPGPKFLARLVYVFLLYSSWRKQDGQQRAGDHAGDADQPRIAPELSTS
jgi:hypothetical protein